MGVITMEVMTELAKALGPPNSKIREAHLMRTVQKSWANPEQIKQIMSEVSSPLIQLLPLLLFSIEKERTHWVNERLS